MIKGKDYIGVGSGAFILNDRNELLLLKRTEQCRNKAGYWSPPGGGVRPFDTVEDTLIREVEEEIGVTVEIVKLLTVCNDIIPEEHQHWVSPLFLCKIVGGELQNLELHKCERMEWFSLDTLPDKLTNTALDGVKHLRETLGVEHVDL